MTQEQIEQLLRPKYKVVALWPFCTKHSVDFQPKIGDILVTDSNGSISNEGMRIFNADKFPHLFEKLEWWEELALEQLPTYVKPHPERDFMKDDKWVYKTNWVMHDHGPCHEFMDGPWTRHIHANNLLPATEADYNEYLQAITHNQEP